jgi:hypothetical protein
VDRTARKIPTNSMVNSPFQLVPGMDQLLSQHNQTAAHCSTNAGKLLQKKARRPRLVWTDGLHLRFVLSVVQGAYAKAGPKRNSPPVSLLVGLKHSTPAIIMSDEYLAECIQKKSMESKYSMLNELIKIYLQVYSNAAQVSTITILDSAATSACYYAFG